MTDLSHAPLDPTQLTARVADDFERTVSDLVELARIPSVSIPSRNPKWMSASADAVAGLLAAEGCDVEIALAEEIPGGHPAVIATKKGPEGAPTVLLYAHHDVQPEGDKDEWESAPFEPERRGDRLFGRGVADDKAGVMIHVAALRALGDDLPVNVVLLIDGEEEVGSLSLPSLLDRYRDRFDCDAIIIADAANWAVGTPALTTSLRGNLRSLVTVRLLDHGLHSGMFGGPTPDALTALCRLVATLHDENGDVAVTGLDRSERDDLTYDEVQFRADAGFLPGTEFIGTGSIVSRLWTKPTITVIGIDAPSTAEAANLIQPTATAKISMRIAATQDIDAGYAALEKHLTANAPWGAEVTMVREQEGAGFAVDAQGPIFDAARECFAAAWGTDSVDVGMGGSIPFVAEFAERFPRAAILLTGVEEPDTRAHAANESLHVGEFQRACAAEAMLLARIGQLPRG